MFTKLQYINVAQFRELVLYDDAVRTLYGKNFFEELHLTTIHRTTTVSQYCCLLER